MATADSRKPKYQKILEQLRYDIERGRYKAGQKLPSEAALVKRFGASRITVGRAVRDLQQQGLIDRVAGSGSYVRAIATTPADIVLGLIIPNLGETEIFEPICQGIAEAPGTSGHALLWPHALEERTSKEEGALQLCHQCISHHVSGAFFAPLELSDRAAEVNHRIIHLLKQAAIPVVLLDRRPDSTPPQDRCDLVGIDNHRAGFLATAHLLEHGARRVGFLAYRNQASTVMARIQGYTDALGKRYETARVFWGRAGSRLELPQDARECDAFVCANDRVAGHLMHSLIVQGSRVPKDVRIVGIDDVNYAALLPVPLTTVRQPCRDIGEAALQMMLDRIRRPKMAARDVLLDCTLIVRESCGAHL